MFSRFQTCLPHALLLLATMSLVGCAETIDQKAAAQLHSIAVLPIAEPTTYQIGRDGAPPSSTGAIGYLLNVGINQIGTTDISNEAFTALIIKQNPAVGARLTSDVQAALQQDGYSVVSTDLKPAAAGTQLTAFDSLNGKADAVCQVTIEDVAYRDKPVYPFQPELQVAIQLTDLHSHKVVFSTRYAYPISPDGMSGSVTVDKQYTFRHGEDVMANPAKAVEGWNAAADQIGRWVAAALKRGA